MSLSIFTLKGKKVAYKDVQYNNRLTKFTTPPIQTGDVHVVRDLTVGRKTYLNDLDISGNLTVSQNVDISGNLNIQQDVLSNGTILAEQYLPGQVVNVVMLSNTELSQNSDVTIYATDTSTIFQYSYTPKIANSYLLIEYQTIYTLNGSSDDDIFAYLYAYDTSEHRLSSTYQKWIGGPGGGTRSGTIFPIVGRYTNSNIDAKTIRVDVYNSTDADYINVQSNDSTWLKITEIGREYLD